MSMPATPASTRREELDERLLTYHGKGLAEVLDMVDYLRDEGDTVIVGGSLSVGLGNRFSDVDTVLVGPATKTSAVPLQHWAGSLRIDAWTRSTAAVAELFADAEAALANPAPLLRAFGNTEQEQQLKLLHRIAFGVIVEGEPVRSVGGRDHGAIARDLLTREYAERQRESACVARLALAAGRELLAAVSARLAVEEGLHAALHARGVPFSGDKWLQEQLTPHDDLAQVHARFANLPLAAELATFVGDALEAAERLTGLPLGEADLVGGLRWAADDLQLLPLAGGHVLAARRANTGWELSAEDAAAWTELATTLDAGTFAHPPTGAVAQASLAIRLYEQGVCTPSWQRGVPLSALTLATEVA